MSKRLYAWVLTEVGKDFYSIRGIFIDFVRNKILYKDQFRDLHNKEKEQHKHYMNFASSIIGQEITEEKHK